MEPARAERSATYTTLACAVDGLTRRGFTEDFRAVDGRLRALGAGQTFAPADLVIREFHRFEGISDPGDMAIVYAIESKSGVRGTFADAFGVYADPATAVVFDAIPMGVHAGELRKRRIRLAGRRSV